MRSRIFLLTYGLSIIFSLVIYLLFYSGSFVQNVIIGAMCIVSCVVRIRFTDRRYVESFSINSGNLEIKYLTAHLKAYSIQIPSLGISGIELRKSNWLTESPAAINIKHGQKSTSYYIMERKLLKEVKAKLDAMNKRFPQESLT